MSEPITNPILNGPYDPPARHLAVGPHGPTGEIVQGRRPSESFIPIAVTRKGRKSAPETQATIDFDITGERRERNTLINNLRREVDLWRQRDYHGATATSQKLLRHWADPAREDRMLFCQREAAETAIFLAEVAGRHTYRDWRHDLADQNSAHNAGLPRVALKMATGSGKTVVMAMLIAWQTLNKVQSPRDARFAKRFLVVAPGITIRDRLRVLFPGDSDNYYDARDLVPSDLRGALHQAQIIITNYHSFLLKDAKEIRGVAANTRKLLRQGRAVDVFKETPEAMVARVLRDFGGEKGEIVVLNDEAHHCYQDKPIEVEGVTLTREEEEANNEARVWFKGVQAVAKKVGVKAVYDMSATPFFLAGSGYHEGYIFPWTVSDFSLMDAIESGIVKIPRTPVDDDAASDLVTYLRLWEHIGAKLPKRGRSQVSADGWIPEPELAGALRSLYRSYEKSFAHWEKELREHGETPPVFIVVCPNTAVSKLVYDWIAGRAVEREDGTVLHKPGELALFGNSDGGRPLARPRTILIDSVQLESGEALKPDFKQAAAGEIAAFKAEYRRRNPGADVDKITDSDLLREVMNTVGKKGKLGEDVRCVVSVAMLTEGWDANTVTHILGIRAFKSQLLCEQVVGRGLRRRSYAVNDDGRFDAEYSNIYGVPFAFIPSDKPIPDATPKSPAKEVGTVKGREHLRIEFPKVDGYRVELPDRDLHFDPSAAPVFRIEPGAVPTWTESAPIIGESERIDDRDLPLERDQTVAFRLAKRLIRHFDGDDLRPWLFPMLTKFSRQWLAECVEVSGGFTTGHLLRYEQWEAQAAEQIYGAITAQKGKRRAKLRPLLRRFDPVGSTDGVWFLTRKALAATEKSQVSHVTLDGKDGNTWEQILALECEINADVEAYVKNDHLGFTIPYVHRGRKHEYLPDFLLRLRKRDGEDVDRTLIVEVSGGQKSPGPTQTKADTARHSWCPAVNNHGGFGRWGYIEIRTMIGVREALAEAIDALYADKLVGDLELFDLDEVKHGA